MKHSRWDKSTLVAIGHLQGLSLSDRCGGRAWLGKQARNPEIAPLAAKELESRRAHWKRALTSPPRASKRATRARWFTVACLALMLGPFGIGFLIAALVTVAASCVLSSKAASDRAKLLTSLREGICPDCAYKVARDIPGGPDACSECGSPWPLVPPAIPDESAPKPLTIPDPLVLAASQNL